MESGDSRVDVISLDDKLCDASTAEFVQSLKELRLHEKALDEKSTEELVNRCLAQFDDPTSTPRCRATALYTIIAQLRCDNPGIASHLPNICKRLRDKKVLNVSVVPDGAECYHNELINAMSFIHRLHPDQLVVDNYANTARYLVKMVSCQRLEIAVTACEFWGSLREPPVPKRLIKLWVQSVAPELSVLIQSLIEQMIYRPELADHLEKHASSCTNLARPQQMPAMLDYQCNLRNYAALAFENMARTFPVELFCTIFRPLLEKRIDCDMWLEKEAIILAFSAFTEANGITEPLQDLYPILIARIIDCYTDSQPLLRSIACFTMPKLVGHQIRGVKDPLTRVLTLTGKAMRDSTPEVRSTALRAMATILAHVGGEMCTHTTRVLDALLRARSLDMDAETRNTYYECVAHFIARTSPTLAAADVDILLQPILQSWIALSWQKNKEIVLANEMFDPELTVLPLSQALSTIAAYAGQLFLPYVDCVFEKGTQELTGMTAAVSDSDSKLLFPYLISHLDLLSMTYDGLKADVAEVANKYKVLSVLYSLLSKQQLHEQVQQSAFALLGHIVCHQTSCSVDPSLNEFVELIDAKLRQSQLNEKTRSNALWALAHITKYTASDVDPDKLFALTDVLVSVFECTDGCPSSIINAAWAFTNICSRHLERSKPFSLRSDVFLHLCGLLRAPFPRESEKATIFHNFCQMLQPVIDEISVDLWPVFLGAVATADSTVANDSELLGALRAMLRSVRSVLSSSGWAQISQEIGAQQSSVLRRRYKLY